VRQGHPKRQHSDIRHARVVANRTPTPPQTRTCTNLHPQRGPELAEGKAVGLGGTEVAAAPQIIQACQGALQWGGER